MSDRLDGCLTFGATAIIELLPPGNLVKKSPHPFLCSSERHRQVGQLMREVLIYKRLAPHRRLIKMMSYSCSADEMDGHVIFEYMRLGSLEAHLASDAVITQSQQLDWCLQATEGIAFLHSSGVFHGDIKPENMVLDDNMCVRIIDFSGSSIDGLPPLCLESARYFLPRPEPTCNVQTDLFALGSSIYHIMQRAPPFKDLDIDEIEDRYKRQDFPELTNVFCGSIIAAARCDLLTKDQQESCDVSPWILWGLGRLFDFERFANCRTGSSVGRAIRQLLDDPNSLHVAFAFAQSEAHAMTLGQHV
ncbi:protein kinase, putative [Cordyceps militaris CM01]|uniref:Protein kinase, putative n=1 Tax=Cordyceps militaris (strain CM01) TaxID=983644 RepID=G3J7D1_CORMM|nr:protein kinase, putative [Cordyceps militaris CM01]EGX96301.1 protein kinase, putative [Cordyceps militaris CM01]